MIELMIAAVLLMVIALGLIPLFAQAIRNNATGSDVSQAANSNSSRIEEALQLPFNSESFEIKSGQPSREVDDSWARGNLVIGDKSEGWWPAVDAKGTSPTGKGLILWNRLMTTQQYSMNNLDPKKNDFTLTADEKELGGTEPIFVHLKQIEVVL
jgi:Tfp pilus assembly protein PilV